MAFVLQPGRGHSLQTCSLASVLQPDRQLSWKVCSLNIELKTQVSSSESTSRGAQQSIQCRHERTNTTTVGLHHISGTEKEQERTGQPILFERLQKYVTKLSRRDKLSHIRVC